ncbi:MULTISPECIES: septum formation initiator family protein [unclassified Streptomyces]|uniref:septum formation initiator family protein n=1 Tax=unclassified Streptomyces TaxID=2593676 RepID=UPI0011A6C4B5|nr:MULTISPECIES: septum formation initiator family protein [Streptomyces]QHC29056.1 septum formation initiator family protein [Streptomyces sp. HF10]WKE72173.1 septum formation initiator family protein [Streptomyces sp. WP-1]
MPRKPELKGRAARLARLFPAGRAKAARTPFVLLVVLLLGGGLIGLLVLNSALSEGSFKLADLQKRTQNLTDEEQALQRDIDTYSSPDALERRAHELGMVPGGDPAFLDPNGTVKGVPGAASPEAAAFEGPPAPESLELTPPPGLPAGPAPATGARSPVPPGGAAPAAPAAAGTPQSAPTPTPGR